MQIKEQVEKIVSDYEYFCIEYGIAGRALNYKLANKFHDKIINSYLQLKELGMLSALERLLHSEDDNVRLWAATHTLKVNESIARKALKELASKSDLLGFSAETTLDEWNKGNLKLEYSNYKIKW